MKNLLRSFARRARQLAQRAGWARRLNQVRRAPRKPGELSRVSYAHSGFPLAMPGLDVVQQGGVVKYQYLHERFPHAGLHCHILYAVSSSYHLRMNELMRAAQARGIKVVWNQNGAYFPSAYGAETARQGNAQMAPLLHRADYVFYQSQFAREFSDYFLGKRHGPSEILYNAVDTRAFSPVPRSSAHGITLLLAGSHNDPYRIPAALETLGILARCGANVRLIIAGSISPSMQKEMTARIARENLTECVDMIGQYNQPSAPEIFRRAHILLHPQYNDVCPSVVIEAMACGLPVVYSQSGGTPELVGADAGYGVPAVLNWE